LAGAFAAPAVAVETPESLANLLCDRTIHVYYNIGNQIEYLSPNGETFFWHPFVAEIVSGTWRTTRSEAGETQVCFQYPEDAPFPGGGGDEFCLNGAWFLSTFLEDGLRDGDPYNLRSGNVPYPLPPDPPVDVGKLSEDFPSQDRAAYCAAATS